MRIPIIVLIAAALGVAVYRASSKGHRVRIAAATLVSLAIAFLAYLADDGRQKLAAERAYLRDHCESFADVGLRDLAEEALAPRAETTFDPRVELSSDRLVDYFREISFCTGEAQHASELPCAEGLRQELYAAARESSRTAIAEHLRRVATAIKARSCHR